MSALIVDIIWLIKIIFLLKHLVGGSDFLTGEANVTISLLSSRVLTF